MTCSEPMKPGSIEKCRLFASWVLCISMFLAGCDSATPPDEIPDPGPSLDEQLIDLITIDGQRPLSNFILPESDDFASIPQDPANPLTAEKVELGRLLFHETGLASNPIRSEGFGTYSCATCHFAESGFFGSLTQAIGEGGSGWSFDGKGRTIRRGYSVGELDVQHLRSPSVLNSAFQEVMGWAGTFGARGPNLGTEANWLNDSPSEVNRLGYDGLESQAIASLRIHRMDRVDTSVVATNPDYLQRWATVFPGEPPSLETIGLAIAAYERTLFATRAPFQRWLKGEQNAMADEEKRGALVFFGKAQCEVCHTGPALNQMQFYALGMPDMEGVGEPEERELLGRGGFLQNSDENFKYKVPQLYNLRDTPTYGHGGTFNTLLEVMEYYNDGIPEVELPAGRLTNRFVPLDLTEEELIDLVLFVRDALRDPDLDRYLPASLPSGNCFPANDPQAQVDLGC